MTSGEPEMRGLVKVFWVTLYQVEALKTNPLPRRLESDRLQMFLTLACDLFFFLNTKIQIAETLWICPHRLQRREKRQNQIINWRLGVILSYYRAGKATAVAPSEPPQPLYYINKELHYAAAVRRGAPR